MDWRGTAVGVMALLGGAAGAASFGDARLEISFDDRTGAVTYAADGAVRLVPDPAAPRVVAVGEGGPDGFDALSAPERFEGVVQAPDGTLTATYVTGDWRVQVHHALLPEKRMVRRWLTFETTAADRRRFSGVTLAAGKVVCATPKGGYFLPCSYPPRRYAQGDFRPGRHRTAYSWTVAPAVGDDGAGLNVIHCLDTLQPYSDSAKTHVTERADGYRLSASFYARGYAHPGKPQQVGDDWLVFGKGTDEDALLALHDWYRAAGRLPPADRPESRMRRQVVYSNHPRGKAEFDAADAGGFNAAQGYLPFIRALGAKTIWMRPVTWPGPYVPDDLYRLMAGIGTEDDLRAYVRAAHAQGLEVWGDAVPHGGNSNGPRAKAHPEFVCKREDGRDQDTFWAYDFNWPTWISTFGDWIEWATRRFELDGWRMDVPGGSRFPNWNPAAPYARASYAQRQGGIAQQRSIRAAARRANPNAVTLGEENESLWSAVADAIYDQLLCHVHFHDFRERDAASVVRDLRRWLHEQKYAYMPGTNWMRYPESHDSMMAENLWGRACTTALMALCAWIDGFPLVYEQGEEGAFETYRRIFAIRAAVPELTMGDADYLSYPSAPGVFACVRTLPDTASVVLINFNDHLADGLPPFGYAVRRLKGAPVESLLEEQKPYLPTRTGPVACAPAPGGVTLAGGAVAELRDLTNGVVRAPYALACVPTADGLRLSVSDWAGLDPSKVRLTIRFAGTERWFAHAAEGSFESPYYVWHPDRDVVWAWGRGHQRVETAVRWSSAAHPFGFGRRHAEVGSVAGDTAVSVSGFAEGALVELRDRLGGERGLAATLSAKAAKDFDCVVSTGPADAACADRGVGTGDDRLRVSAGGWTYEDGKLKVRLYNSGAIAGVWTRGADGAWREEIGLTGYRGTKTTEHRPTLGWRLRDENVSEQSYDCYGTTTLTHGSNDTLRLSFRDVRPKLFGKRYLTSDIEMAVDYVFGRDTGAFRTETYFRLARGALGKANGIWEYRLRRPPGARGTVGDFRFTGKRPVRTVTDGGTIRWIYHDAETPDFTAPPDWIHRIGWTFRAAAPELPFVDLTRPASVTVDGEAAGDAVTVGADGQVTIRSEKPLSWVRLAWPARFAAGTKVFGGEFERTYGDSAWHTLGDPKDVPPRGGARPWYFLATDGRRTDGYGLAVQPNVLAAWHVATNRIELVLDCRAGARPVTLGGRTLVACRLVSRRGADGERPFAAGRAFCRRMCPSPRLPKEPVYGYNDWYCAYGQNTATNFLADAAFICSLVKGEKVRPFVVVDDGWQANESVHSPVPPGTRWAGVNARWGMPMDEVARRVKALGARPGLWYRPLLPDAGDVKGAVPIDPTDPALPGRIRTEMRRFVDWGYELVKIDFITSDWCGAWGYRFGDSPVVRPLPAWRDGTRTTAEVVKGLYAAMREGAGEGALVIGCNALDHLAAGLFELQRTGDDTSGTEWDRTRRMGPNTLGMRAIHDRTFYAVDGDCFGLVNAGDVPDRLNLRWLDLLARSGTALFVSWKRQLTTPQTAEALERALRRAARAQPTGEPLDWLDTPRPQRWDFGGERVSYSWDE